MEVAGRDHHVFVGEDVRVVGHAVDLILDDGLHVGKIVFDGTVHLRDAAETVGILHVFLRAVDQLASFQNLEKTFRGGELSSVGTDAVAERQEGLDTAVVGFERHRADQIGPFREAFGLDERPAGVGAHELGAVEQGQAFLRLQADGLPAHLFPHFGSGAHLPFVADFTHPDNREAEVGEGSQVAGGAERALLVHHGEDVVVVHIDDPLHGDQLGAGVAVGERLRLEQEHQAHDVTAHFLARAAGVRHHEVVLELREVFRGDRDVVQGAEAGGDAIDRVIEVFHLGVQILPALLDGFHRLL